MNIFRKIFGRSGASGETADDYTEPQSGLIFPMELGGLRRFGLGRPYAEDNGSGESIPYGANQVHATIYVTTVGGAQFPEGGESDFIRNELESAMAAVQEMQQLGYYDSIKFFSAEPQKLGSDPANLIWARGAFFTLNKGRPMMSFTYITALRSHVIKLRISASDPKNDGVEQFPHALGDLISRQRSGHVGT